MTILEKQDERDSRHNLMVKRRVIFEGAIYHITQRAPGKELVFLDEGDYLRFLKILKETVQKFDLELYAFALLSNHVHLLFQIKQKNLSGAMKYLFERYAKYFNKKYSRKGHVFCGRFRASLCSDDEYLLTASIYIHMNAFRAGLCVDPKEYRWSSINLYITNNFPTAFISNKKILSYLDIDLAQAKQIYIKLLEEKMKLKEEDMRRVYSAERNEKSLLDKVVEQLGQKGEMNRPEKQKIRKSFIEQLLGDGYSQAEISDALNISKATFYRIMSKV